MKSSRQWLKEDESATLSATKPSLSPIRDANRNSHQPVCSMVPVSKPKLSPSRVPQQRLKSVAPPAKAQHRPLAPIFLKDYTRKRKDATADSNHLESKEIAPRTTRYPERARKLINDSYVVSDGALSDSGNDDCGPRKKKSKN